MRSILLALVLCSVVSADDLMLSLFESLKKQERKIIIASFKQEKKLRSNLKSKPRFYRKKQKMGNFQNKNTFSKQLVPKKKGKNN